MKTMSMAILALNILGTSAALADWSPGLTDYFLISAPDRGTGLRVNPPNTLYNGHTALRGAMTAVYKPPYDWAFQCPTIYASECPASWLEPVRTDFARLQDVAPYLGFNHFNWLQVIIHDDYPALLTDGTHATVPYVDPPFTGVQYTYVWSDSLIYLFNEPPHPSPLPSKWVPGITLDAHILGGGSELTFGDRPSASYGRGKFTRFATHLVGVKSSISWSIIDSFYWSTNYNKTGDTGGIIHLNPVDPTDDPLSGVGGVFDVHEHVGTDEFPEDYKKFLISLGADNVALVPEPTAWSLILIATLLGLFGERCIQKTSTRPESWLSKARLRSVSQLP